MDPFELELRYVDMDRTAMPMGAPIGPAPRGRAARGAAILRAGVCLCLALLPVGAGAARAEEIAVVVNPALTAKLDLETVKKVFLGKKDYLGDIALHPVDYRGNLALRDGFLRVTLSMSRRAFNSYWVKEVFRSGHVPPIRVSGYEAMLKAVAADPGAIGYVPAERVRGVTSVRAVLTVTVP